MSVVSFESINAAVKAAGGKERVVVMGPVFRFVDGDTSQWAYTTVHARTLAELTLEEWVERWGRLRAVRKAAA